MSGRQEYESRVTADIVNLFAGPRNAPMRQPGISDADRDAEYEALRIYETSRDHFLADLERAAAMSDLRRHELNELRDAVLDNCPVKISWIEAINAKIRGWK